MPPLALAALISGGFGLASNVMAANASAKSQAQANQATADSVKSQEDFQMSMSNTAHQREVKDLEAAGLNPILSANSGASTPMGAMATFKNPNEALPGAVSAGVNSAQAAITNAMDIQSKKATIANVNANTAKTIADTAEPQLKSDMISSFRNFITSTASNIANRAPSKYDSYPKIFTDPAALPNA